MNNIDFGESNKELHKESLHPIALAIGIPSVAFILLFFPATTLFSHFNGFEWSDIIFFNNLPIDSITHKYTIFPIPVSGSKIEYPLLFSLLTAYGIIGLMVFLLMYSNSLFRIFITTMGMYWGYYMVYYGVYLLTYIGLLKSNLPSVNMLSLKLIYIFSIYYLFESLIDLFSKDDYRGDKFRFLFPGLQGLATGWILEKEFNNNAAIFNGIAFLACSFVSIFILEILITKIISMLKRQEFQLKNLTEYMKPVMFDGKSSIFALKQSWKDDKVIILSGSAINAIFPFIAYLFWKLVLL
ncbi:MAG: hypothetical protein Q7J31_04325 [Syntrophales bacterium]|nr:hypothetical protein [Syntrophales bacterium]